MTVSNVKAGTPAPAMVEPDSPAELVNLSVRIKPELAKALRRAAAERSVDRIEPYTQQAIVAEALAQWLVGGVAMSSATGRLARAKADLRLIIEGAPVRLYSHIIEAVIRDIEMVAREIAAREEAEHVG